MIIRILCVFALTSIITGCAAVMVPSSNDPGKKLAWSQVLIEEQNRPLPAERLIREAIEIYKEKNDTDGLAEAYRSYGIFFFSNTVARWEQHYKARGFIEPGATFDQRFDKAIKYLKLSRNLYASKNTYSSLSNVDLNLAWAYERKGQKKDACTALDSSRENHKKFLAAEPDGQVYLAKGYSSFADAIEKEKKRMECI